MLHANDKQGVKIRENLDGKVEKGKIQGIGLVWRMEEDSDFILKDCHLSRDSVWGEDVGADCNWDGKNGICVLTGHDDAVFVGWFQVRGVYYFLKLDMFLHHFPCYWMLQFVHADTHAE